MLQINKKMRQDHNAARRPTTTLESKGEEKITYKRIFFICPKKKRERERENITSKVAYGYRQQSSLELSFLTVLALQKVKFASWLQVSLVISPTPPCSSSSMSLGNSFSERARTYKRAPPRTKIRIIHESHDHWSTQEASN